MNLPTQVRVFASLTLLLLTKVTRSQSIYTNTTGIGGTGPNERGQGDLFADAARHPIFTNNVSFPGFDFSLDAATSHSQGLFSAANWTWHLNVTTVNVTNQTLTPNDNRTQLVTTIVYDLQFPASEPSLPQQNETDWTMCGHFLNTLFPANLTSRFADETGDCNATLGSSCLAAYRTAFLAAPLETNIIGISASCPDIPFWSDIPECVNEIGRDFGMVSSSLMNWSYPNAPRLLKGPFHGLFSTQPIFWQNSQNYDEGGVTQAQYFREYSQQMRMMILSFQPSRAFLANHTGIINRDVEFLCQAADPYATADRENTGNRKGVEIGNAILLAATLAAGLLIS